MTEQHSWNHLLALILHHKKLQSLAQPWTTWSTCLALRKSIMGYQWKNWGGGGRHVYCTDGKSQEEWNTIKRHLVCQRYFDFTPHELQFLYRGEKPEAKTNVRDVYIPSLLFANDIAVWRFTEDGIQSLVNHFSQACLDSIHSLSSEKMREDAKESAPAATYWRSCVSSYSWDQPSLTTSTWHQSWEKLIRTAATVLLKLSKRACMYNNNLSQVRK